MDPSDEETPTSTLFVADVPSHLQEREFSALFASCDGFLNARLRHDRNDNVVGFIDFEDSESASRAKDRFQDYKFNPLNDNGISVHFSHSATRNRGRSQEREGGSSSNGSEARRDKPSRSGGGSLYGRSSGGSSNMGGVPFDPLSFYNPFHHHPFYQSNSFPPLPTDACQTLYVEGLPLDATEREVAHIFRPWAGFQSLRILPKESKQYPNKIYNLCFVEFDNKYQSSIAMHALQGYKMDKMDTKGLSISYAKSERKDKRGRGERNKSPNVERSASVGGGGSGSGGASGGSPPSSQT